MTTYSSLFKNVFVINRSIDKERMQKTDNILSKNNIKYQRFEAITIDKSNKHITKEVISCALSHIHIWDYIASSDDIESAVIFEDDICFKDNWKQPLKIALKELPKHWDILTLGNTGIKFKYDKYDSPFNLILYTIVTLLNVQNKKYDNQIYNHITIPYFFTGAYGYAISKQGAKKLLNLIHDINFHIDVLISSHADFLNIYSLNNDIVYQRTENSTISVKSKKQNDKLKLHLNLFNDSFKDSKNVSYNYYMNVPVYKYDIFNKELIINGWFIFILLCIIFVIIFYNIL